MKSSRVWVSLSVMLALVAVPGVLRAAAATHPASASYGAQHVHINCAYSTGFCTELGQSARVFGYYVGHDEPSVLFLSDHPGSGNRMRYYLTLPKDPSARHANRRNHSFQFELAGADWLGMAMCDTQSFPEQLSTCPPDSDKNIVDPNVSPKHVGEAYMEMQFYPPGWVPWPTWAVAVGASACDPARWCAALNIDSLSYNPVTGQANNQNCQNRVGEEYVNFAFITKSGQAQAPANPVDSTLATFTPNKRKDLFMNSGDRLQVSFRDTSSGLRVTIHDLTTGASGSMTASAANGFAQVKYDPNGTSCKAIPYNFHPMYSTSSTKTRVTWAAGSYNVAYDTEIGHFQFCRGPVPIPATQFGILPNGNVTTCPTGDHEERPPNGEPADNNPATGDDFFCFPGSEALVYKVSGCTYTNTGFDGASYEPLWPDGTSVHPTPLLFSSPETGATYNEQYSQIGFETDLPVLEATCNISTGAGCHHIPQDDDGQPATFYPFYSTHPSADGCVWEFGNDIPGETSDFGQNGQYGSLLQLDYTAKGGHSVNQYSDFRKIRTNPCPQG